MSFIDKYYEKINNSVGEHNLTISRLEFANLLGVFSKHEQQLHRYKQAIKEIKELATVNSINTCWAFLNECDHCEYKEDDNFQCPQTKLKDIFRKCEVENGDI